MKNTFDDADLPVGNLAEGNTTDEEISEIEAVLDWYDPMLSANEFNTAFEVVPFIEQPDDFGRQSLLRLRLKLIAEEYREVAEEFLAYFAGEGNLANLAKELADLKYVIYGTEDVLSIPAYEVFNAVHESNMSKLDDEGKPVRRNDGKVLKGPNYMPPDIESIINSYDNWEASCEHVVMTTGAVCVCGYQVSWCAKCSLSMCECDAVLDTEE